MNAAAGRLTVRREGAIGWLQFDNLAKHNAISMEMAEAMPGVMAGLEQDEAVRVIVLSGAGTRAFAAGSDISGFDDVRSDPVKNRRYNQVNEASYQAVYACSKPTIAMIRGYCIGGGLDFAASCDIRIAADDAKFAVPAGRLGLGYGHEGILRLGRVMGLAQARDMFLTARRLDAAEALAARLVHRVVPALDLESAVRAYAQSIADNAPLTLAALKGGFLEYEKPAQLRDVDRMQALIDACFASEDYREGRQAFAEKRKPQFKGR